ncbi:MAG: hypothetical protein ABSB70_20185 [Candidatus Velthaea sp.]|jgi:hypothetical protein
MSAGSWQAFADALEQENRCLGELGAAALALTGVLVCGTPAEIEAADRMLDARRIMHAQAHQRRVSMMKRGFGDRQLRQVCAYAPPALRRSVFTSLRELRTRAIALQITVANNKTLINAGLTRIANTIAVIQKSLNDEAGTYRRRGKASGRSASLMVSRKA